jgi:two-component system osmolarity sensor histidine kinase EnvZ
MDYARPSELQLQPLILGELVDRVAQGFRDPQQMRIYNAVPPELKVWADDTELGRVLLNLFENARRYGRTPDEAAKVEVTASLDGLWVQLLVRDFGPGVPMDKLSKLTTPFFRGDAARTAANGAGLGLAIVEKSVQRLGGRLEIGNAEGGGLFALISLQKAS